MYFQACSVLAHIIVSVFLHHVIASIIFAVDWDWIDHSP